MQPQNKTIKETAAILDRSPQSKIPTLKSKALLPCYCEIPEFNSKDTEQHGFSGTWGAIK